MADRSSRRTFLKGLLAIPAGVALWPTVARAEHYPAMLCGNCGFGSKKDNCARCGKWMGSTRIPARLCGDHGFGSKKENCVECGKWIGSSGTRAFIGDCCGFGGKKDNCVICGKWAS